MVQRKKNRGGRPRKSDSDRLGVQLALRIDPGLLRRLDAHVARVKTTAPGLSWSRGAAIRELLAIALDGAERPAGAGGLERSRAPRASAGPIYGGTAPAPDAAGLPGRVLKVLADWNRGSVRRCPVFEIRRRLATDPRAELDRTLLTLERDGSLTLDRARGLEELASLSAQDKAAAISDPGRGLLTFVSYNGV